MQRRYGVEALFRPGCELSSSRSVMGSTVTVMIKGGPGNVTWMMGETSRKNVQQQVNEGTSERSVTKRGEDRVSTTLVLCVIADKREEGAGSGGWIIQLTSNHCGPCKDKEAADVRLMFSRASPELDIKERFLLASQVCSRIRRGTVAVAVVVVVGRSRIQAVRCDARD